MALAIVFTYLLTSPFYIFQSGYPQPADFILVLGIMGSVFYALIQFQAKIDKAYILGITFAAYAFLINIIHYFHYDDIRLLLTSLIYSYNVAAFIFISFLLHKYPHAAFKILFWGAALSIIGQFIQVQFFPSSHPFRATGTFNNPNQLAYWALLVSALLLVIKYRTKLNIFDYGLLSLAFYIQMLSLSKAGIITSLLLIVACLFSKVIKGQHKIIVLISVTILSIFLITQAPSLLPQLVENDTIKTTTMRILNIGTEADDSLEGRGYHRLLENPTFLILGAGEGAFWRYDQEGYNQELHSGVATLLFAYGPFGTLIFCAFIFYILKQRPLFFTILFILIMLFGATHQNLRFSMFWVFLASINGLPRIVQTYSPKQNAETFPEEKI